MRKLIYVLYCIYSLEMYDLLKAKKTNVKRSDSVHTSVTFLKVTSQCVYACRPCVQLYWMRKARNACVS